MKVVRLDRLSRPPVLHLVPLGAGLRERGIGLHIIEQGIDTATTTDRAMFADALRPGRASAPAHRGQRQFRARPARPRGEDAEARRRTVAGPAGPATR
ncbi:recombinase family protein [Streptomyces noursei]|uniref:recombinase family protein n=1 Tax=Streptomyces noursei TaxID=1971 RepID=UPI003327B449